MRKFKIVALLIACIMVLSGCSLVRIDEERAMNRVVATVNGVDIYRYQVDDSFVESQVASTVEMYTQLGMDMSDEDIEEMVLDYQKITLDGLVMTEVLVQKAAELDITLSEEEKQECRTQADESFASERANIQYQVEMEVYEQMMLEAAEAQENAADDTEDDAADDTADDAVDDTEDGGSFFSDEQQTYIEQETEARYQAFLETSTYTPDTMYTYLCRQALSEKVAEYTHTFASVSDEEVTTWYNDSLALQQQQMEEDADEFASLIRAGQIYLNVPKDTVAVKQILLAFDDELKEQAQTKYELGEVDEMMELVQDAVDELMPTALDLQQQLEDGGDIDALIEEHNDDPGMTQIPGKDVGYLAEERTSKWLPEFTEAALGLMELGAVSEPVITYNGVHILQSIKIYETGIIPLDDIFDDIKEAMLPGKKTEKYDEMSAQWLEEATVKYYYDRLSF